MGRELQEIRLSPALGGFPGTSGLGHANDGGLFEVPMLDAHRSGGFAVFRRGRGLAFGRERGGRRVSGMVDLGGSLARRLDGGKAPRLVSTLGGLFAATNHQVPAFGGERGAS
jgi:hypothetical protein